MPRYYFDLHDGVFARDDAGTDLADVPAVRAHALRYITRVAAEAAQRGEASALIVTARDADDRRVLSARLVCGTDGAAASEPGEARTPIRGKPCPTR